MRSSDSSPPQGRVMQAACPASPLGQVHLLEFDLDTGSWACSRCGLEGLTQGFCRLLEMEADLLISMDSGSDLEVDVAAGLPTEILLGELNRRVTQIAHRPSHFSEQVCPRCSTPRETKNGIWDRRTLSFECTHCELKTGGDAYERALEDFYAYCWRAEQDEKRLRTLRRSGMGVAR